MLRHNARALLREQPPDEEHFNALTALLPTLEASHRPVVTDNKLDRHEWLYLPEGRILKCDAVEHSRAHDLVGCQDPAWDVVGAVLEFSLNEREQEWLLAQLYDAAHVAPSPDKLRFYALAYLAFRAASAELAHEAMQSQWPQDARLMAERRDFYVAALRARLP
jgi:hypothetical protein